ncbi:hypothetical protein ElyMa_005929300 [Elysia marginata]|uniref:Uncharacterized protein n=1 Tax=Elysia marginata TaxID=1093978 RepID=A0AAV4G8R5_9GAST|nr:hypothetical protein ElyMa_005929300 [Elysia marginata]
MQATSPTKIIGISLSSTGGTGIDILGARHTTSTLFYTCHNTPPFPLPLPFWCCSSKVELIMKLMGVGRGHTLLWSAYRMNMRTVRETVSAGNTICDGPLDLRKLRTLTQAYKHAFTHNAFLIFT